MKRVRIGISLGDPSGIGAEVTARALAMPQVARRVEPVLFGDTSHAPLFSKGCLVHVSALPAEHRRAGKPSAAGGRAQLAYVEAAIDAAQAGHVDALCTAPVSKKAIAAAGVPFVGHTELLAERFGCEVMMLMAGPRLSVALATNHLALTQVPQVLTRQRVVAALVLLDRALTFKLSRRPRIAVCALNPHAGEGGLFGDEERRILLPAIATARRKGIRCDGPHAADGLFATAGLGRFPYDVALAMFHDQGLVATKTLDFRHTVNVTLGLPVPRTSPDHGVAYALAGKGQADALPMAFALLAAADWAADHKHQEPLTKTVPLGRP